MLRALPAARRALATLARPRRSVFYVPGAEERKIAKARTLGVDCVVLDLEDGVSFNKKADARKLVLETLESTDFGASERAVRINAVGSGLELDDLTAVLQSKKLETVMIPKVHDASHVHFVSNFIRAVAGTEAQQQIRLIACIESALGVMNVKEIAQANDQIAALLFASEDYCADTGMVRTPSRRELYYARSAVVTAACAYGKQSIDLVCMDFKNDEVLRDECREGREMGFTGKQAVHPAQVAAIQALFQPSELEIDRARRILDGYARTTQAGKGAFELDGKVIDMPVVTWATRLLARVK